MEQIIAVAVGIAVASFACSAFAAEAAAGPDAASLIRDMRNAESWVDQVKSLEMVVESTWSRPEEAIARRRLELAGRFPGTDITPEAHPELRAVSTSRTHVAFDRTRVYLRYDDITGPETFDLRFWDGERLVSHTRYDARNEQYHLDSSPSDSFGMVLGHFTWLRAAAHRFWFMPEKFVPPEDELGRPEEYHLMERELFHEVDCYVLERARDRLMAECREQLRQKKVANLESWCIDYREVSPGRFAPMTMGYSSFNTDELGPKLDGTREMKVTKLLVDEPIADALFRVEFKEGVQVNDWGHEPPLSYKYKKDRTLEEWQAILDEANAREERK